MIAHIEDKCTAISYSMILMSAPQTFPCPVILHFFDSDSSEYRIYMAPNWTQPATPETTFVRVTCNAFVGVRSSVPKLTDEVTLGDHRSRGSLPIRYQLLGKRRTIFNACSVAFLWLLLAANGRVGADLVIVNGQEERHPEGAYYLEWWEGVKRVRLSVGKDAPMQVLVDCRRKLN